ncbi:MAG: hypothetical protein WAL72_05810 [Streptosporangiaceae bacterium]
MAGALTATLGLAAGCWVVSVWQMTRMEMAVETQLGSFAFFAAVWVAMMAAMMLPGAAPALARAARAGGARTMPLFAGSYLASGPWRVRSCLWPTGRTGRPGPAR